VVVIAAVLAAGLWYLAQADAARRVPYSTLERYLDSEQVTRVVEMGHSLVSLATPAPIPYTRSRSFRTASARSDSRCSGHSKTAPLRRVLT
jgi:hypothetical protein